MTNCRLSILFLTALISNLAFSNWTVLAEGRSSVYRGSWTSQSTGHTGPMRVRISPKGGGQFDARFTGRFALVIPFTYRATLTTVGCDHCGNTELASHKQLGPIFGAYNMSASMTAGTFAGGFQAAGDQGQISMRRIR